MTVELGKYGIWRPWHQLPPTLVVELEKLGFGTVWVGSSPPGDLEIVEEHLDATSRITIATSVVNMWTDEPSDVAAAYHRIVRAYPDRFMLGVGIGHPEQSAAYRSPFRTMVEYLAALEAGGVPRERRVLAALGPKALRLAREQAAGAIPYLVTPDHTRRARAILGPTPILAPEHKVVVETDPERARAIGRARVRNPYLGLTNYLNSLRELGYGDDDLNDGGSDRLVDDLALHGTPEQIALRVGEHFAAGADHVVLQLLTEPDADPLPGYVALAGALPE
ncbi:MAG TPA: LLM class F420-dependent oxidoreductase [Jatrophihabitans sp.]|nr:LLM class F420-dependent oxidoreductase [Jatrophihabitans sp.]